MSTSASPGSATSLFPPTDSAYNRQPAKRSMCQSQWTCCKGIPKDIIITVLGPTGSGKTRFINALTGGTEQHRASGIKPDTKGVTSYTVTYHDHRLILVDTLGFDEASRPDQEVLRNVADWLNQKYPATVKASRIIYLHRITDNRMSGSALKNLQTFRRLCGNIPLGRARLVTTMWDNAKDRTAAETREDEFIREFWRQLIDEGAVPKRFDNTDGCAWDIVRELIHLEQDGGLVQQNRIDEMDVDKFATCFSGIFTTKRS